MGGGNRGFALATDFASLERKMDGVNNGLCDGFYATANGMDTGFAAVQNALCRGFSGVNQAVVPHGYESRLGTQALQAQLAQCCCDTQAAIQANTTQGVMNTDAIRQQVASCCCENEKQAMQTRFENQQNQYLTDTLRPCPSPAYTTCNPWAGQPYGPCAGYGCGCN